MFKVWEIKSRCADDCRCSENQRWEAACLQAGLSQTHLEGAYLRTLSERIESNCPDSKRNLIKGQRTAGRAEAEGARFRGGFTVKRRPVCQVKAMEARARPFSTSGKGL